MKRLIWCILALFVASIASAQSLAEVAKKERERRAKLDAEETRTITDVELLRNSRGPMTTSTTQIGTESEEGEGDDAEAEEEQEVNERQTESYWRDRLRPIDERIRTIETQLQSPEFQTNVQGAWDRQRLEQQLAQARARRQAILDEARRAGVPPGWLR